MWVIKLAGLMASVPQFIDLPLLIEQRGELSGEFPLVSMPRLLELATSEDGCVSFDLTFGKDAQGIDFITGHYRVSLQVKCQRCLTPFNLNLTGKISLAVIENEAATGALPGFYEPLIHGSGRLSLPDLLEDEIILTLPMAPLHLIAECPSGDLLREYATTRESPFAVLKGIKNK